MDNCTTSSTSNTNQLTGKSEHLSPNSQQNLLDESSNHHRAYYSNNMNRDESLYPSCCEHLSSEARNASETDKTKDIRIKQVFCEESECCTVENQHNVLLKAAVTFDEEKTEMEMEQNISVVVSSVAIPSPQSELVDDKEISSINQVDQNLSKREIFLGGLQSQSELVEMPDTSLQVFSFQKDISPGSLSQSYLADDKEIENCNSTKREVSELVDNEGISTTSLENCKSFEKDISVDSLSQSNLGDDKEIEDCGSSKGEFSQFKLLDDDRMCARNQGEWNSSERDTLLSSLSQSKHGDNKEVDDCNGSNRDFSQSSLAYKERIYPSNQGDCNSSNIDSVGSESKLVDDEGASHEKQLMDSTMYSETMCKEENKDKSNDGFSPEKDEKFISQSKCRMTEETVTQQDAQTCRICYDDENVGDLCSPCKCSGSIGFVHQSCMFHWIGGRSKLQCEICQHKYEIERTTKAFLEWSYPWVTHRDLYFIFMVIFSQEWIHVMESFILLISMYIINIMTESSGFGVQFWVIIGLEIAYYCTHYICGLLLLFVRKWSALNQKFSLLNYDSDRASSTAWYSEDGSKLLYCLDLLVSFLLANPILKRMADKMVA